MSTGINIAPSSGLTVGTTAVTSGTNGRVFFQAGGVVQQSQQFTFEEASNAGILRVRELGNIIYDLDARTSAVFNKPIDVSGNSIFRITTGGGGSVTFRDNVTATSNTNIVTTSAGVIMDFNGGGVRRVRIDSRSSEPTLQVRAAGALSTDIAFRVRNSADTDNLIESAGNGLVKFRTGTERIEINTSASDYKMSLYKFGVEMTRLSTYSSYFCFGGSNQYLGIGTNGPSHLLDIYSSVTPILTRWTNDENNLAGSDVTLKFTTRYTGGSQGGNPMAYLTVGGTGAGVNLNNKSYFKFLLSKANTLAERASITSQSNLLLQAPTEDTNDVGVIYIPNGTAPTVALAGGGKLYVEGGALKFIGSSGTITTIAPA